MPIDHPPGSPRMTALLGDHIHTLPPYLVERLERCLAHWEQEQPARVRATHLALVPDLRANRPERFDELERSGNVAVPLRVLEAVDAVLEILHAEHIARRDGDTASLLGEHLVEGLLVAGREMIKGPARREFSGR